MTTLYLKYKGSRNYLQGGDIYNAIDDLLSARFSGHLACLYSSDSHVIKLSCSLRNQMILRAL